MYLRKTAKTIGLIAILIIVGVAISVFSSGILQNNGLFLMGMDLKTMVLRPTQVTLFLEAQ